MRILNIVRESYPTSRPDIAALFGRYLPRLGVFCDIVAQESAAGEGLEVEWGGGQTLLSRRTGRRGPDQLLAFAHDIRSLWRARAPSYDAIQVRDKVFAAVFAIWVGGARGLPVFYWMSFPMSDVYVKLARDGGPSLGVLRWLFLLLKGHIGRAVVYRYVLPRCTHVFVQSQRMLEDVAQEGIPRERMTPVPMGVDLEGHFPTHAEAKKDERLKGRRVIAYLGSFERFRRMDFLLEVMQELCSTDPDLVLLMIGDGSEPGDRERLELTAASLGIAQRVLWTGWVSQSEAWSWLANADVAVSFIPRGKLYDCASPTKVVEYLALGIPAVANDQPDQKAVLEESSAGFCREMEQAAVVAAIRLILGDSALAERMKAAGPPYVAAERGYARIAARVAEVYRRFVPIAT